MQKMFEKIPLQSVVEVETIVTIHYFDYSREFAFSGESHDFWEMVFVDYGSVYVTAGQREFLLEKHEAFFHVPGEYHNIRANNAFAGIFIITFELAPPCAAMQHLPNEKIRIDESEKAMISAILREGKQTFSGPLDVVEQTKLVPLSNAPLGAQQMIKIHLEQLLISILRKTVLANQTAEKGGSGPQQDNQLAAQVLRILEENLYGNIRLDDICKRLNFSETYIKKQFKNTFGCGIYQMYTQMKISLAKKLLSERIYTISEISDMLGFGSIHHFSKVFRTMVGMPPSAYVKSVKMRGLL